MGMSDKDRDLEKFEEYLRQKAVKSSSQNSSPSIEQQTEPQKSDFAKALDFVNNSETEQPINDPDWVKFKQFLRREADAEANRNDSGMGQASYLPHELNGLNWGAAILTVIWGGAMKVPGMSLLGWALLLMLPVIGFIFPFYLLLKGNEIAWKNRWWSSHDEFRAVQKKWTLIGVALAVIILLLFVLFSVWIYSMIGSLLRI